MLTLQLGGGESVKTFNFSLIKLFFALKVNALENRNHNLNYNGERLCKTLILSTTHIALFCIRRSDFAKFLGGRFY